MNKNYKKVLIVGLGLIGGSYAKGLTKRGYEVYAISNELSDIKLAKETNVIIDGRCKIEEGFISGFDFIIMALYPHVLIDWLKKYQGFIKNGAIITDVTGVKKAIIYDIQGFLRPDLEFIGAHPMAGKETSGFINSDYHIFENANYIITPTKLNSQKGIDFAKEIGEVLGFKKISFLTPEEHDEMIGFLSQLTHCIAVSLMTCKESHHLVDYTGDSFRDLTRIAKINENMWYELFILNKAELISQMDLFMKQFERLRNALAIEDEETVKEMMATSTKRRAYFDK